MVKVGINGFGRIGRNVLRAALRRKVPTFIASTSEVYGKAAKFPFAEDDDLTIGATRNLRWSYACAKTLDEFLALYQTADEALAALGTQP